MKRFTRKEIRAKLETMLVGFLAAIKIKTPSKKTKRTIVKASKQLSKALRADVKKLEKESLQKRIPKAAPRKRVSQKTSPKRKRE